jgi:hypothetical protein
MNKRSDTQREPRDHADSDSDADGRILIDELVRGLIARGPPVGAEVVAEENRNLNHPYLAWTVMMTAQWKRHKHLQHHCIA